MLGLLRPYCVGLVPSRWAKREREAEDRRQFVEVMRLLRAAARERARLPGGNSAKAIREPGLFRWSGSAVRCPGGQAVFDGAVFTAKGEG